MLAAKCGSTTPTWYRSARPGGRDNARQRGDVLHTLQQMRRTSYPASLLGSLRAQRYGAGTAGRACRFAAAVAGGRSSLATIPVALSSCMAFPRTSGAAPLLGGVDRLPDAVAPLPTRASSDGNSMRRARCPTQHRCRRMGGQPYRDSVLCSNRRFPLRDERQLNAS